MRRYTQYELESMDITTLKAICRDLKIKVETMSILEDKGALIQLIYKYRGILSEQYINNWDNEKVNHLKNAIKVKGEEQKNTTIEIPAHFKIYKGIDSLNERGKEHKVYTEANIDMTSAVLIDQDGEIQGFINVSKGTAKNTYILKLRGHMLKGSISPGIYRNYKILFFPDNYEKILRIYNQKEENTSRFTYITKTIQEVVIQGVEQTEEVLVIDYGTSYTTAGTYDDNKIKHVWFHTGEKCEQEPNTQALYANCKECGRCALCPSVIAVKECDGNTVTLMFGHKAKDRSMPTARNSIFFDTKRWVNNYEEEIDVKDLVGNTGKIKRSVIIEQFMKYIIHTAEQQNKVRYKNICFTSPVKQKAMSISMYKNILQGYEVEERDAVDEAVAVVYDSVARQIENLEYEDGDERNVLLIDCGGSTSDMVKSNYKINRHKNSSKIEMKVGYANGDTNFGGNNLTYRIMQYVKIKLAQYYKKEAILGIDDYLNVSFGDVFDFIDKLGITATYETFEEAYHKASRTIPTNFSDYTNDAETIYFNIRSNFYFLWNLAEQIKVELYSSSSAYEFSFDSLKENKKLYMLTVKNEKDIFVTHTEWPTLRILRDEINLLLKPEIYNLLKKFIEPYYREDETMSDITDIILSGQTTKIGIFRDVLKEYIAGQKARAPFEHSYAKKIKCIRGAVAYHGAKTIGRIRSSIGYESAVVPYNLIVETFNEEKEKKLISQGQKLSEIYSYIDRPYGTKQIMLKLKDHDKNTLQILKVNLNIREYPETNYDVLLKDNPWLKQGDIDRIEEGDLRLFIYTEDESWGFKYKVIAHDEDGKLISGVEDFLPFESTEWEKNFFDGKR